MHAYNHILVTGVQRTYAVVFGVHHQYPYIVDRSYCLILMVHDIRSCCNTVYINVTYVALSRTLSGQISI